MPTFYKPEDATDDLTRLILKAVPENERGNKTLNHACKILKVTKWAMRKWINAQKISPERAMQIVEMGRIGVKRKKDPGRVSLEELHPFVYK